jgi:hypothetical protein
MIGATETLAADVANYRYVAAEQKSKGNLRAHALEARVLELYLTYMDRVMDKGGPRVDPVISKIDQKELEKNADYLTRVRFKSMKEAIKNSTRWKKCPYCYQINATEVDHYLPKSKFGEYAVYAPNLVPICRTCNGKKLAKYTHPEGGRGFLHPYFDKLPDKPDLYLAASISVGTSVIITFMVVQPVSMAEEIWKIHRHQFAELDLAARYAEDSVETVTGMLSALEEYYSNGDAANVSSYLRLEYKSKERIYGPNHWWPVLLNALASSNEFCDGGFKVLASNIFLEV